MPLRPTREWWKIGATASIAMSLALGMTACGSETGSGDQSAESFTDDGMMDSVESKADVANGKHPLAATYVTVNELGIQPGDMIQLTLSTNGTFHAAFAMEKSKKSAKDVSGTYKYTKAGGSQYLRLYQNGSILVKFAWRYETEALRLRKVGTQNWFTLQKGKAECGGFVGSTCPEKYSCVDIPGDGCDPRTGGADCGGICVVKSSLEGMVACGGPDKVKCEGRFHCEDDPNDNCDPTNNGVDCAGLCVFNICSLYAAPMQRIACGGFLDIQCPTGLVCEADPTCNKTVEAASCDGYCGAPPEPQQCRGIAGNQCPARMHCEDDPDDPCDPTAGGADCMGMCMPDIIAMYAAPAPDKPSACGGFANLPCPTDMTCVDNPNDGCDPADGGADCSGICIDAPQ